MPPKKPSSKPSAKKSSVVEIVALASSSPGRISRRTGAALEKELVSRAPPGLPPPERVRLPEPTPNRFISIEDVFAPTADESAPAKAARRSLSSILGAAPSLLEDEARPTALLPPQGSVSVGKSTSSQPLSSEALMGAGPLVGDDPGTLRQAIKVAEALPAIAQSLFLFANLHWSQIGFSHDASPREGSLLQPRGNFYVINGSSTERGGGKAASVPPSPGKPLILSPPPTPSKAHTTDSTSSVFGGIALGGDAGKENLLPSSSPAASHSSAGGGGVALGSVPIDERLLGAVGNRCPFTVTKDHVEQAAALFSDRLRTDWTQLNAPRLCFLGQRSHSLSVPSTNDLRTAMMLRFGTLEAVAKKVVLVTSASLAESLRKQHGPTGQLAPSRAGTADLLASIRKSRADQVPLVGVGGMTSVTGNLSSRIHAHQQQETSATVQPSRTNMRLLLQSVSSALNTPAVGTKRSRDESGEPSSAPPPISASLLAALPQEKLQEVVSAASVDHLYTAHDLSKRLQRQINLERTMELFDLVCAVFGPTRTSMSGGRLLQQLVAQNSNGDSKETIKEQLNTLVRLGQQGSGLTATAGSLVDFFAGVATTGTSDVAPPPPPTPSGDEDLSDRLVVLNRSAADRKLLERAIDSAM